MIGLHRTLSTHDPPGLCYHDFMLRRSAVALIIALFCLPALPGPALSGAKADTAAESVRRARELLGSGRPAEALEVVDLARERYPDRHRLWELEVLREACRDALAEDRPIAPAPGRRLRVAQVLLFEGESLHEVTVNLRRLKEAGVDTVFIRVFHNQGDRPLTRNGPSGSSGVYFRTAAAPLLRDYLGEIVPLCRRLGLSVFAWMTTRRSDWLLSEEPGLAELHYDGDTRRLLRSHSLNIFHPVVRRRLLRAFRDLAAYDIDGILFQDDLVMRAGEGFSPEAIEDYMEDGGSPVTPESLFRVEDRPTGPFLFSADRYRPAFWDWVSWKNRELLAFADELMAAARSVRGDLRFALNLYYEAVLNPRMALAWYGQDLRAAERHPFDYFSLMSYHRQIGRELSLSSDEALGVLSVMSRRATGAVSRPEKIIMKIQALDWKTSRLLPATELDRALAAASREGVSLAFVRSLQDPPLEVIKKHFGDGAF